MCWLKPSPELHRLSSFTVTREIRLSPKMIVNALIVLTVATTVYAKKQPKIEAFFQGE